MKGNAYFMMVILILVPLSGCTSVEDDTIQNDDLDYSAIEYSNVILKISHGDDNYEIEIKLNHTAAPLHSDNFRTHIIEGNYDDSKFHRIIDNFMIQGGDFELGIGSGGYAAKWYGVCNGVETTEDKCLDQSNWNVPDETDNGLMHLPCTISMAKTSQPDSGGSQFFIIPSDSTPSHLNGVHTVFGEIVNGCDDVTEISEVMTDGSDRPIVPVIIYSTEFSEINFDYFESTSCQQAGSDMDLRGIDFTGCNFENMDLSYSDFTDSILIDTNLINTNFTGTTLINVDFSYSNMAGAILEDINFSQVNLDYIKGCASVLPLEWNCYKVLGMNFWADQIYGLMDANQEYYDRINNLGYHEREDEFYEIIEENNVSLDQIKLPSFEDYSYYYLGPECLLNSGNIYGINASNSNMSGCTFNNLQIGYSDFSNSNFTNSYFYQVNIINSNFSNIESTNGYVYFQNGNWANLTMYNSSIGSLYIYQISIKDVNLMSLQAEYVDIRVLTENLNLLDFDVETIYWYNYNNCSTILLDNGSDCFGDIIIGPNINSYAKNNLSGLDLSHVNLSGSRISDIICPEVLPEDWICIKSTSLGDIIYSGIILSPSDDLSRLELSTTNLSNLNITSSDLSYTRAIKLVSCPLSLPIEYYCLNHNIIGPKMNIIHANLSNLDMSEINFYKIHARNLPVCPLSLPDDYTCMLIPDESEEYMILGPNMLLENYEYVGNGANTSFTYSDMTNLNLTNMTISNYDFTGADFSNTTLDGTIFGSCICPDGTETSRFSTDSVLLSTCVDNLL